MADGKNLKFQFVLDEASFQRVKRALGELTTEAQKFAKAMQSSGGGMFSGANVGAPPSATQTQGRSPQGGTQKTNIGAAILGDVEAFQKLAKSGKQGMSAMTDAVRTGVREQIQEINKLEAKMARLHERMARDPRAAYEGAFRTGLMNQMLGRQGQLGGAQERLGGLQSLQAGLGGGGGGMWNTIKTAGLTGDLTGGLGVRGMMGAGVDTILGPGLAGMIARSVSMGVAGAGAILNTSIATNNMAGDLAASRGRTMSPMISRARSGGITDQLKMRYISQMDNQEKAEMLSRVVGSDTRLADLLGAAGSTAKSMAGGDFSLSAFTDVAGDTRTMERLQSVIQAVGERGDYGATYGRAQEYEDATRGERISSSRIRGAGHYLSKKVNGKWTNWDPETGRQTGMSPEQLGYVARDTKTKTTGVLMRGGYSDPELDAATVQARAMAGGQFAGANAHAIMAANAAGYGGYGQMMAGAARAGGGLTAGNAAMYGGIDRNAAIQLGAGIFGSGFDVRGTTRGLGMMGAAQGPGFNFTGGVGDFNEVQRALAGMQAGSGITSGGLDSYQAGRNILAAIGANPGGTTYAQDYLGTGMSFKQMVDGAGGDMTKTAKNMGLTPEMLKSQLSGSFGSVMDRWVDQGGNDQLSRAMRGYRKSGNNDPMAYAKELYGSGRGKEAEAIGDYFGLITGEGEEAGEGAFALLGGVGNKAKKGKGPAGGLDTATKAALEAQAKLMEENAKQLNATLGVIVKTFGNAPAFESMLTNFSALTTSVENVVTEFDKLAGITPEVREKMNRNNITSPTPAKARPVGVQYSKND